MKKVSICQSNYIPWKGYFDLIKSSDIFIIYDDAQYTKNDWRNRNQIKTPQGLKWLTIPIETSGRLGDPIKAMKCSQGHWKNKHLKSIEINYAKTECFKQEVEWLRTLYSFESDSLSQINIHFIKEICKKLQIDTEIRTSMEFKITADGPNEKILQLLTEVHATHYLSGPSARNYLDMRLFSSHKIKVDFMKYDQYPEYAQPHPPFAHNVSVLDLILCTGEYATKYLDQKIGAKCG